MVVNQESTFIKEIDNPSGLWSISTVCTDLGSDRERVLRRNSREQSKTICQGLLVAIPVDSNPLWHTAKLYIVTLGFFFCFSYTKKDLMTS